MKNKNVIRAILGFGLFMLCLMEISPGGSRVEAEEESCVIREETGGLERLEAIRISDEELDELREAENSKNSGGDGNTSYEQFLDYGSDYGYRDMTKRSNSAGRQYAYRQMESLSKNFTTNKQVAGEQTLSGSNRVYYVAGIVDLTGYNMTVDEKIETYYMFRNDNPQYFWLSNYVLYGSNSLVVLTYDEYMNGEERLGALEEIMNTAQDVYQSQISPGDHSYQKVLKIHDALIEDIEYPEDTSIPTAHSIAGAMTSEKTAVCEGYAKVMQLMMNCYGISNIYVTGDAGGGHAWNMVCMNDGKYYWLDATWDDQPYEIYRHTYFLVGNQNFTDHKADLSTNTGSSFLYELPLVSDLDYVYSSEGGAIKGDITEDGIVDLLDLMQCLNHVANKNILEGYKYNAADVDGNGTINLIDLMRILNYVSKKSNVL